MTADELARLGSTTTARIDRLVEIGVLRPDESGRFDAADVQRVQIVAAFEAAGIELEHVAMAIRERRMSFEFTDRIYPEASPPSGRTVADLSAALALSGASLVDLLMSFGLPRPTDDQPLSVDDERMLSEFVAAWIANTTPEVGVRAARLLGNATRHAAEGWVQLFTEVFYPPADGDEVNVDELRPRMFEPAVRIAQAFEPTAVWLLRRHLEHALNQANVEGMELGLAARGIRRSSTADPPAIVFADVSGFTRLTDERGDELAVRYAAALSDLALRSATEFGGRLVKQLGDGVMLAFPHRRPAVEGALALRSAAAAAELPPLHIGISAGPVIERDGDYFGRTVNLASRISGVAGPGEIVSDRAVADVASDLEVVELGTIEMKGFVTALPLFRLEPQTGH